MEENIKSSECRACGRTVPESLEVRKHLVLVTEKYRNHRKNSRGARSKRNESLFASKALFMVAGVMAVFAMIYDRAVHSPVVALGQTLKASNMSPSAVSNMLADNLFILVAPVAVLFLVSQTLLLQQIRQKVSYRR